MSLLRSVREKSENIQIQNVIQNYTLMRIIKVRSLLP